MQTVGQPRISERQLLYLLSSITFPTELFLLPGPLIQHYGKDALWAILLGAAAALVPLALTLYVVRELRRSSLEHFLRGHPGWIVRGLMFLLAVAVLLPGVIIWGGYAQLIRMDLLPRTPPWTLVGATLLVVLYALPGRVTMLGRLAEFLVPFGLVLGVGLWVLGLPWYNLQQVLPLWPQAPHALTYGAYEVLSFLGEVAFGAYLSLSVDRFESLPRTFLLALLFNAVLLLLFTSMAILMFGPEHSAVHVVPPVAALRAVHYGFLVERVDILIQPIWVMFVTLKILIWTCLGASLVARVLGLRSEVRIAQGAAVVAAVSSLHFGSLVDVENSLWTLWYPLSAPIYLFVIIAGAAALYLHRRRALRHA